MRLSSFSWLFGNSSTEIMFGFTIVVFVISLAPLQARFILRIDPAISLVTPFEAPAASNLRQRSMPALYPRCNSDHRLLFSVRILKRGDSVKRFQSSFSILRFGSCVRSFDSQTSTHFTILSAPLRRSLTLIITRNVRRSIETVNWGLHVDLSVSVFHEINLTINWSRPVRLHCSMNSFNSKSLAPVRRCFDQL